MQMGSHNEIDIVFYVQSGDIDPVSGLPGPSSLQKLEVMMAEIEHQSAFEKLGRVPHAQNFKIVLGGERTLACGPWNQCDKLREYVAEKWPWRLEDVDALPYSTGDTFGVIVRKYSALKKLYFFGDEDFMDMFLDEFRLRNRVFAKKVVPKRVTATAEFRAKYSGDYILCYRALTALNQSAKCLLAGNNLFFAMLAKAFWLVGKAVGRVGLMEFWRFYRYKRLNRQLCVTPNDAALKVDILAAKANLRADLRG